MRKRRRGRRQRRCVGGGRESRRDTQSILYSLLLLVSRLFSLDAPQPVMHPSTGIIVPLEIKLDSSSIYNLRSVHADVLIVKVFVRSLSVTCHRKERNDTAAENISSVGDERGIEGTGWGW